MGKISHLRVAGCFRILAWQPEIHALRSPMVARIASLTFAVAALAGAVIFAQQKGREKPRPNPVFDTSKSGAPTPWPDDKGSTTAIQEEAAQKAADEKSAKQQKGGSENAPAKTENEKHKRIMPSSKSMVPEPPVKKPPPPPT
ncbi:hypothetical protein Turpa_0887 [Turneriella parva DSM 21527]|uniref:Uncharacterized protein n=2 Tax=Turneriella TaxID=338321 RepID=I4B2N1_TURPD|nr:hypothetical protein Turpa_0887 [Turneriella parva DSM 21527]